MQIGNFIPQITCLQETARPRVRVDFLSARRICISEGNEGKTGLVLSTKTVSYGVFTAFAVFSGIVDK